MVKVSTEERYWPLSPLPLFTNALPPLSFCMHRGRKKKKENNENKKENHASGIGAGSTNNSRQGWDGMTMTMTIGRTARGFVSMVGPDHLVLPSGTKENREKTMGHHP
jgi:hypothetical protein